MKLRTFITLGAAVGLYACSSSNSSDESFEYPERPPAMGKADAWNAKNDPKKFADFLNKDLEYKMDALPREGRSKIKPWAETYWPTYEDGTNHRWHNNELSPLEKYDVAFNGFKADAAFMALKPFTSCGTAFDKEYYDKLGPAAKYWSANKGNADMRDGDDSDGDGEVDECGDNDGIESWWGLCHAWTPAALNEPEPLFTIEHNGVKFYPSDIKALMITVYDHSRSLILGGRCNTKEVERDEHGRIKDPDCRDTNAGAFHVIAANLLGRYQMGFAEDRTYDYQVWNQPVYDFKVNEMTEIDAAKANDLLGTPGATYSYNTNARKFWEVKTLVRYVTESSASTEPTSTEIEQHLRSDNYHYIVEGDADGKIIGGEWINGSSSGSYGFSNQPDFLWVSTGPGGETTTNPSVAFSKVKMLRDKALTDPGQPPPTPETGGVCKDKCSSSEPQSVGGRNCYCDSSCFSYGDCCEGRAESCGGAAAGSCSGHCGESGAAPGSVPPNLCYCDTGCVNRGDCCSDYAARCN